MTQNLYMELGQINLIGLALPHKTTNENGQSAIDCGKHWQQFEKENISDKIPNKISSNIFAVYHDYEHDFNAPYAYFIGCRVSSFDKIPDGLSSLIIQPGSYKKYRAKGKMPDCVGETWVSIWKEKPSRAYRADFEIYSEKSMDWMDTEVDIFISIP